jgi:hypothetical protein
MERAPVPFEQERAPVRVLAQQPHAPLAVGQSQYAALGVPT